MLDAFLEQHARSRKLKTAGRIERLFAAHVRPMLGRRSIYDLRKSDTADLSAHVATHHGLATAHMVEGYWNQALAWRSARDDDFNPPIVRGLSSYRPGEHARSRVLDDPELCDLKTALAELGDSVPTGYPPLVWALLLSAQRRQNVASMHWAAIVGTAWVIAADSYKTGDEMTVPLSGALLELLGNRKEGFIFGRNGARPFSDFGRCKLILDRKLTEIRARDGREPMTAWVIHDLRRTARSLMSRAGVPTDHAERVLGHAIPGVRAVYDRHDFYAEKANALEALARLVNRIVDPTAGEVFSFGQPRQVRA